MTDGLQVDELGSLPDGLRAEEPRPGVLRFVLPQAECVWHGRLMIPFLCFFLGLLSWMTVKAVQDPTFPLHMFFFTIPFWVVPLMMLYYSVSLWHATRALEFEGDSLHLCTKMRLLTETRQRVTLSQVESVLVDSNMHLGLWNFLIIKTGSRKIRFAAGVNPAVLEWLAARIRAGREQTQ